MVWSTRKNCNRGPADRSGTLPSAQLIGLTFIRSHVTAVVVLVRAGTRIAALVGLQQMTLAVPAAARITGVNRRAV